MKAVRIHEYGPPEVLRLEEVPKPSPGPRDVLVRVHATSVNPVDCKIRSGGQRNIIRYRLPWILGLDVSGVAEAVGRDVRRFREGDEVWSSPTHRRPGTYAEYTCIDERELGRKPKTLSHAEAASLPLVALTARQCLTKGGLERGQTALIEAGAGGVGAAAIQLAKHAGARVIATCSARNAELVRALGADEVIDYRSERLEDHARDVDFILDSIGPSRWPAHLAVIRAGGSISNISLDVPEHVARHGPVLSLFTLGAEVARLYLGPRVQKRVRARHVVKKSDGHELDTLADLVESGALSPTIDSILPLEHIVEAHRKSETHRARGKIVLEVKQ